MQILIFISKQHNMNVKSVIKRISFNVQAPHFEFDLKWMV